MQLTVLRTAADPGVLGIVSRSFDDTDRVTVVFYRKRAFEMECVR
jgi:hypothetical protein